MLDMWGATDGLMRSELPDKVIRQAQLGHSALIVGLPTSGRSRLLTVVGKKLRELSYNVLTLTGSRAAIDQPFSSLTLSGIDVPGLQPGFPRSGVMASLADQLMERLPKHGSVLIIDDLDEMDQATISVLCALRRRHGTPMILSCLSGFPLSKATMDVAAVAQPCLRLQLPDLLFAEVGQMVRPLLGGRVDQTAISQIAALSGGLPGLVEAIVAGGVEAGRLVEHQGQWISVGDLYGQNLGAALLPLLRTLDQGLMEALVALAKVNGIEPAHADQLVGHDAIDALMRRGLVRLQVLGHHPCLYVYPLALARDLQEEPSFGASIESMGSGRPATIIDKVQVDAVALVDSMAQAQAARVRQWLANWQEQPDAKRARPLLAAVLDAGDLPMAESVLAQTVVSGSSDDVARFVALKASHLALFKGDLPAALVLLRDQLGQGLALDALLLASMAHLTLLSGQIPDDGLLASLAPLAENQAVATLALAEIQLAAGAIDQAGRTLAGLPVITAHSGAAVKTLASLQQILTGRLDQGVQGALGLVEQAIQSARFEALVDNAYVAILGMALQGQFHQAETLLEIIQHLPGRCPAAGDFRAAAIFLGAVLARFQGRADYAQALVHQSQVGHEAVGPFPGMTTGPQAGATLTSVLSSWARVDDLIDRGLLTAAVFGAVEAAEKSADQAVMQRLLTLADRIEGPTLKALLAYAAALCSRSINAFPEVIAQLAASAGAVDAIRARVSYALLLRESGDMAAWIAMMDQAYEAAGLVECRCDGIFKRAIDAIDLSPRELEIACLVGGGMSPARVSNSLSVSGRTVEAHLSSVYRKTGATGRSDLSRIVRSWLTLASGTALTRQMVLAAKETDA
ncbi:MAG: LuxR C-terminal-related transcriptional regulator [Propionibacteriaceae bacterium]|nr:LuxR C-terminal-related transcriptional regulator [Propionibacteriaceae bacterium]